MASGDWLRFSSSTRGADGVSRSEPSAETVLLLELLACWKRRDVWAALSGFDEPGEALCDGRVRAVLQSTRPIAYDPRAATWSGGRGAEITGYLDADFPPLLKHIPDPPLVLFYRGALSVFAQPTVAIVGARRCTSSGRELARHLGGEMARPGCCILSGLAAGVDAAAHDGALRVGGLTAAFLGSGLEQVYPRRHAALAESIVAAGGVVVSEYPSDTPPRPFRFPERNRLISGASMAVVVVEASRRSGSLITARLALEQGRDVYACPGPVQSPLSVGCHDLIRAGAGLVTEARDVLNNLGLEAAPISQAPALEGVAAEVYAAVDGVAALAEEIALRAGLEFTLVCATLTDLELNGFVRQDGLGYIRTLANELE